VARRGRKLDYFTTSPNKGFRFPVEIISHCVSLSCRFPLSFREGTVRLTQLGCAGLSWGQRHDQLKLRGIGLSPGLIWLRRSLN